MACEVDTGPYISGWSPLSHPRIRPLVRFSCLGGTPARNEESMYVLGINQHHDSAAALVRDGQIIAFCEEERLSRRKHDGDFPARAIQYCLDEGGITLGDVDRVAYFWQGHREILHAVGHFARHFPDTLAVVRNDGGYFTPRAQG